jgi:hypothetical protein
MILLCEKKVMALFTTQLSHLSYSWQKQGLLFGCIMNSGCHQFFHHSAHLLFSQPGSRPQVSSFAGCYGLD